MRAASRLKGLARHELPRTKGERTGQRRATIAAMDRPARPCSFEPVKDSPDVALQQERVRGCRCDLCVEARSFVAVGVEHSLRVEVTDRIAALMWRAT
jgi:hypothetical protein